MTSTSPSKLILAVKDLSLSFAVNHYSQRIDSFRELFVGALRSPYDFFFKKQDRFTVLKNINFTLSQGERLGILGVNGAGKTSLCRCIAGILNPASGSLFVDGIVRSVFNATIGVNPELTGRENAALLSHLLFPNLKQKQLHLVVEEALNFSELGDFIDTPFKNYSKGMQARLCLSIISALPADLLILDEVLDGADQFFREKMAKRMENMITASGATIVVSHNLSEIERICTRLMIIDRSKILFDGNVKKGIAIYQLLGQEKNR